MPGPCRRRGSRGRPHGSWADPAWGWDFRRATSRSTFGDAGSGADAGPEPRSRFLEAAITEREIRSEAEARRRLVAVGGDLYRSALVGGRAGNLSLRLDSDRLLVTPSGAHLGHLDPGRLVVVPLDAPEAGIDGRDDAGAAAPEEAGAVAPDGSRSDTQEDAGAVARATSELPFHRAVYRARPDVAAVVHTHAPALTAAGLREIDVTEPFPEIEEALGSVRSVPFRPSGSRELARCVAEAAAEADVLILLRHGVVAVGATPEEARDRTELAELTAWAAILARDAGIGVDLGRVAALHARLAGRLGRGSGEA